MVCLCVLLNYHFAKNPSTWSWITTRHSTMGCYNRHPWVSIFLLKVLLWCLFDCPRRYFWWKPKSELPDGRWWHSMSFYPWIHCLGDLWWCVLACVCWLDAMLFVLIVLASEVLLFLFRSSLESFVSSFWSYSQGGWLVPLFMLSF
jgi:hypothetical protein